MIGLKNIVEESGKYVFDLFKEKLSHDFVYHNYQHTLETVEICGKIAEGYTLSEEDTEALIIAAWFHDTGYIYDYTNHEDKSKSIAQEFLDSKNYPASRTDVILQCIDATKRQQEPPTLIGQILCDADLYGTGDKAFFKKADLLRAEWENFNIRYCDELEWAQTQLDFLSNISFHTAHAQKLFGEQLSLNLREQSKKLKKLVKKDKKKKSGLKKSKAQPKRGIETMFRSLYRNHITLSSIADNKANMMISINAIIISVMLTIVGAKFSLLGSSIKENPLLVMPAFIMILGSLGSVIFAILSAKPKVTDKISDQEVLNSDKISILFFGNFTNLSIMDFQSKISDLMKDENQLYGNMTRDLYYLGKVLTRKYNLLRYSYTIFMYGLILTVFMFIGILAFIKLTNYEYTEGGVNLLNP